MIKALSEPKHLSTFRDNYLAVKKGAAAFILFLFLSSFANAQQGAEFRTPKVFIVNGKGDARQVFDGVTNGTTTFTSATANFTSADAGKIIRIPRGTSSTQAFVGSIASVSNSTTVILNSAAAATTSADTVVFGTDNTAAMFAARDACNAAGGGVIFGKAGWYLFGGALVTSYYGTNPNAQIPWPVTSFDSSSGTQNQFNRKRFVFRGEATGLISLPVNGGAGAHPEGTTIYETIIDGSTSSGVPASFFGTKSPDAGNFNLNANEISFEDLTIMVPTNEENHGPSIGGINAYYSAGTSIRNCAVVIDGLGQSSSLPTNDVAGVVLNRRGGELKNVCENTTISGFPYGLITSDHCVVDGVSIYWCNFGRVFAECYDLQTDYKLGVLWCKHLVYIPKTAFLGGMIPVNTDANKYSYFKISSFDAEIYTSGSAWYQTTTDCVSDSTVVGRGMIFYALAESGNGLTPATQNLWKKQNADSIWCYNIGQSIGVNPNGLSGGQTINGGTGSGENLILSSTSHATKGKIYFGPAANNNYFNEAKGNIVLNQSAAVNYSFASYQSDLTGGGALFPGMLLVNTNVSSPGGGQYNIASVSLGAGNNVMAGQFAANFGAGATAPFTVQGFIIGTRSNDPVIFFQNSNQISRLDATGYHPFTTATFDLGTSSLVWRSVLGSGATSAGHVNVSGTGTYSALGTDNTIEFTGTTATLAYPTVNLVNGRRLSIINYGSGSLTIPSTKSGNASTITTLTTNQKAIVEYDLANTTWILVSLN